jgi:hypothetical protein
MTETPIAVLHKAADLGLRLKAVGNDLHVNPRRCCPPEFANTLRAYKRHLLTMLSSPFVMVYSQALGETVFFCEDEDTKASLVQAGADEWSIYTKDELRVLMAHNRAKTFLPDELCKLHKLKWTFHGRITT